MQVRRLKIHRFRGIERLVWCPGAGMNCLVGPGDVGKSTILDALAFALSSAPGRVASEHDYFAGAVDEGFKVEVLLGKLDDDVLSAWPAPPLWTWSEEAKTVKADPDPDGEGVLCVRVRGTADLEVEHLVVDPSEGEIRLSPSKRQRFGLSTMGSAGTAYRELRMSRGSLLSRNVDSEQLRGLVTAAVQATRDGFTPSEEVASRLKELSEALQAIAPGTGQLDLALMSPRGQSLLGMVGLFEKRTKGIIPLANAGLGTQQLALFTLAQLLIGGAPLFVIDEVESGLEPFRQRDLVSRIRAAIGTEGQAFVTTHSPAVVGEMAINELHRVSGSKDQTKVTVMPEALDAVRRQNAEALLSRMPTLAEGQTEMGLLEPLLQQHAAEAGTTLGALGVRLIDGGGQPKVFKITEALTEAGQRFGAFLDSEATCRGKRAALQEADHVGFGTYSGAYCLEEALSKQLSLAALDELIATPGADGRDSSKARYQQLTQLAGDQSRTTITQLAAERGEMPCRELFSQAANEYRWFKTRDDGRVVGAFLRDHHPGVQIVRDVAAFWEALIGLIPEHLPSKGPRVNG